MLPMQGRNKQPEKLLWVDLEMTGLEPSQDRIIEVGVIITDFEFNELDTYEAIIKQDLDSIELDDWIKENLTELLTKVPSGENEQDVERKIIEMCDKHFNGPVILAGNSIHQDRRFIRKWWPELEAKLHYRMLDVSSFKVWVMGKQGIAFRKPEQHRALEDIRGSIEELKYYIEESKL